MRGGPVDRRALGAGVYYEAAKHVSIVLEADGLAGFPIFSFVADVNLSLQFNFYGGGGGDGKSTRIRRRAKEGRTRIPK